MNDADDRIAQLRAAAHPIRLRILSMLAAEPMSAADVARTLDLTHANASYHLRVLHQAGEIIVEGTEKVRGGVAKRYRYDATRETANAAPSADDRVAYARATAMEVERRLLQAEPGSGTASDIEAWVPVEAWHQALELMHQAALLLHAQAQPSGTPDTVHVSATVSAFTMAGGLTGEAVRWQR